MSGACWTTSLPPHRRLTFRSPSMRSLHFVMDSSKNGSESASRNTGISVQVIVAPSAICASCCADRSRSIWLSVECE
jgi:hypothetical protein